MDSGNAQALSGLAWIRATSWDPALRDASEAVALAERAAAATERRSVSTLDALAAAYAAAGGYDEAVAAAPAAVALASAAGQTQVATQICPPLQPYQEPKA